MNDSIRKVGRFLEDALLEPARQKSRARDEDMHREGFTRAAGISLHRIQEKLDALTEQMNGPGLARPEQAFYVQLNEFKSEIEAEFDRYWRGTGVDWRPPKPVAKAIIRRGEEPQ